MYVVLMILLLNGFEITLDVYKRQEYHQIGAFVDSQIFVAHLFQLPVDIGGNGSGRKPCVVDQAFHSTVLIWIRTGITVYGDKNIGSGCVAFGGLLVRGLDVYKRQHHYHGH